ncbi:hypothetical protein FACS1894104_4800 [Actinomycetota bacterium]|nr:hypothetical protein FACS1894104_4800 [Actinomycetota bacterium]
MQLAKVYPMWVNKVEKKGRTKKDADTVICWLTGYSPSALDAIVNSDATLETFLGDAPLLNPNRSLIKGVICGIRVEDMEPGLMQEIRYLDKLIDELAKGRALDKILR